MKLFITDIDNTVFDWVAYYSHCYAALVAKLSSITSIPEDILFEQSRQVFERHYSIEYPFVIQELPAINEHYRGDIDRMLNEAVEPSRRAFLDQAQSYFSPYEGVVETLQQLRRRYPDIQIVALTDAPRYVAMWKLNKLALLPYFSAVYGLADPRVPTCSQSQRVKVSPSILLKHLQQYDFAFKGRIRILPDEYEKPGTRGLKTVLMDYDCDEDAQSRSQIVWLGDNLRKDVQLGKRLGLHTLWAQYGTCIDPAHVQLLHRFSPLSNIERNMNTASSSTPEHKPDQSLKAFSDLLDFQLWS